MILSKIVNRTITLTAAEVVEMINDFLVKNGKGTLPAGTTPAIDATSLGGLKITLIKGEDF